MYLARWDQDLELATEKSSFHSSKSLAFLKPKVEHVFEYGIGSVQLPFHGTFRGGGRNDYCGFM